ncbi:hypothetical protein [Caldimonas tepidiphila]|uniref:hypothetical protein n=1 Tax=Caldimonas tepidiphila TaxID=2315841 RepID=UPI001F0CD627|nr:hypothetical protein [Caldimonas tepidiphila]
MLGDAVHSPNRRGISDLMERVARLEAFERWRTPTRIDYPVIATAERWAKHQNYLSLVLAILAEAEVHAKELREHVEQSLRRQRDAG